MSSYQYRVVPAPTKGQKTKGIKNPEDRFAHTLEELMNQMGADGWEYQRAETLPSVERAGLTGSTTEWRHVLVFRKQDHIDAAIAPSQNFIPTPPVLENSVDMPKAEPPLTKIEETPTDVQEIIETPVELDDLDKDNEPAEAPADAFPAGQAGAVKMLIDNGVEEASEVSGMTNTLRTLASRRFSGKNPS